MAADYLELEGTTDDLLLEAVDKLLLESSTVGGEIPTGVLTLAGQGISLGFTINMPDEL